MIKVEVPIEPFSINKAFQGRRFKTKDCKYWEKCFQTLLPKRLMVIGKVGVKYRFFLKNHAMIDFDNLIKIMQDNLVKCGYIEDDRKIYKAYIEKIPCKAYNKIEIEIYEIIN
jgi:Holliday junction resolvase RusA-like endonuclease